MESTDFSPSAAIFLGAIVLAAAALVVVAIRRRQKGMKSLAEYCRARGWSFNGDVSPLLWVITGADWRIEAHAPSKAHGTSHADAFLEWKSPAKKLDAGALVIAVRTLVAGGIFADMLVPDEYRGRLTGIRTGTGFHERFTTLASDPGLAARQSPALEKLIADFAGAGRPGIIGLRLDREGLTVRTPHAGKGETIQCLADFGTGLRDLLR